MGMLDWLLYVAGNRSVVYKPETAYWGNYDIAVPLLLPIYPLNRLRDLQSIAAGEATTGHHIQGQLAFSSGWEWGYWLSDVIAAEAAWNPRIEQSPANALASINNAVLCQLLPDEAVQLRFRHGWHVQLHIRTTR